MKLAILSDIHDHENHLLLALAAAHEAGCSHLLCAGDVSELSTFRILCDDGLPLDAVFGNNEYDLQSFARMAAAYGHVRHLGKEAHLELAGRRIHMSHYPWQAARALEAGGYDLVIYGHTHRRELRRIGDCILLNPGDVYGRFAAPSIAIYDSENREAQLLLL